MKKLTLFLLVIGTLSTVLSCKKTEGDKEVEYIIDSVYFPPEEAEGNIAIIIVGGSEGGVPEAYYKEWYGKEGYPVLALGYFNTENTPDSLELIPLEYFNQAIEEFRNYPEVGDKKIIISGGSKGGELALLLASINKNIEGVIATVPSSVSFQGISPKPTSSWSLNGESVPFVPYVPYDYSTIKNFEFLDLYIKSLEQKEYIDEATIKVENINGPILMLSGEDDTMWPATTMCNDIVERLKENDFKFTYEHIAYEDAGHTLNPEYLMGGTVEGNKIASTDSEERIFDFLKEISEAQ